MAEFPKIGSMKSVEQFRSHLADLGLQFPVDDEHLPANISPMAQPIQVFGKTAGNRFAIHPMEGWDAENSGVPSDQTYRRWRRFGASGAKLIWGGEAAAVHPDGRANPNQLMMSAQNVGAIADLRAALVSEHEKSNGTSDDLVIGLQLTHSGRFCRPNDKSRIEPKIAYHHPLLDRRFGVNPNHPILTDSELNGMVQDFVDAANRAYEAGFDFVDVKHCHGYLLHELLSAHSRPGCYGGSLENRSRFLCEVVEGIRATAPGLGIGVRLSAFDLVPYKPDPYQTVADKMGPGIYEDYCNAMPYKFAFGVDPDQPTDIDLTETVALLNIFRTLGITVVNLTAGSPYYNPHIQRPALYPPSDGYQPPEDPLVGVARQMTVVKYLKQLFPDFVFVGSAYSYLQDYVVHVAQAAVREGWVDVVGLGRMALSYPDLPRDVLTNGKLKRKQICRTFSDCTTAPRMGFVSGCYPLDPFYKIMPEAKIIGKSRG